MNILYETECKNVHTFMKKNIWTPPVFLIFFTFFERILYKSNCIIFIFSWCGTHTKIRSKLVVIVTAGSQKITLWGPRRTPLGILRVKADKWSSTVLGERTVPVSLCPPQITHGLTWDRNQAHTVRTWQLKITAMSRSYRRKLFNLTSIYKKNNFVPRSKHT